MEPMGKPLAAKRQALRKEPGVSSSYNFGALIITCTSLGI